MRLRPLLITLLTITFAAAARVQADLTPEMVKRFKQATALVRVVDNAEGTAFHIGDGVFLTNHHVIEDAAGGAKIEVVLNSGEKNQKVLPARLARADEKLDLAIIKVDEKDLPPAVEIGDGSELIETMSVAVFGFPFGSDLAVGKNASPNISVNVGRITALRKAEEKLDTIQTDISVSPGNSGGPLVDGKGKVIGVIQAHVPGTSLTFAIPADQIRRFLFGTGLILRVTPIQFAAGTSSTVSVEVVGQRKEGAPEPTVVVRLSAFAQDQREYKALSSGAGLFTVSAPLVPAVAADDLNADVEDQGDNWSIRIKDQPVKLGVRTFQLSAIKEITQGSAPGVELLSGQRLAGTVSGLKSLPCIRNGKASTVDLSRVQTIRFSKPTGSSSKIVSYEITVRNGADVIASQKGTISADGVRPDIARAQPDEREPLDPTGETNLPPGVKCIRLAKTGHFYAGIQLEKNITWAAAVEISSRLRFHGKIGHLATVSSADEGIFIDEQFRQGADVGFWLGGFRDKKKDATSRQGRWAWITGEPWVVANWDTDQPNDVREECLLLYGTGRWHDALNEHPVKGFIVEFE